MIERLIGRNRWGSTGWHSYNQLKELGDYSDTWQDRTYTYIAVNVVGYGKNTTVEVYRQPYLKAKVKIE